MQQQPARTGGIAQHLFGCAQRAFKRRRPAHAQHIAERAQLDVWPAIHHLRRHGAVHVVLLERGGHACEHGKCVGVKLRTMRGAHQSDASAPGQAGAPGAAAPLQRAHP